MRSMSESAGASEGKYGPTVEEQRLRRLVGALRALEDDQLEVLVQRVKARSQELIQETVTDLHDGEQLKASLADPVNQVEFAFEALVGNEPYRRHHVLDSLEAEMAGGHLVSISYGDELDTFAACCDPRPDTDGFCWEGPDRATIDDAVEDGRQHHPGHEIEVVATADGWSR